MAHEIRTPLTLIKGPLENIILKKDVDAETREDLNIMEQNTERLLNLTNQLLDFRKTESQGFSLNFTRCNITEVVQKTHLRFTSLAKQKGLDLTLKIPERACYAHVNKEAFTKILSNLLSNAMKYAESYVQIFLETDMAVENGIFHIRTVNDGPIVPDTMKRKYSNHLSVLMGRKMERWFPAQVLDWRFPVLWLNCIGEVYDGGGRRRKYILPYSTTHPR